MIFSHKQAEWCVIKSGDNQVEEFRNYRLLNKRNGEGGDKIYGDR